LRVIPERKPISGAIKGAAVERDDSHKNSRGLKSASRLREPLIDHPGRPDEFFAALHALRLVGGLFGTAHRDSSGAPWLGALPRGSGLVSNEWPS